MKKQSTVSILGFSFILSIVSWADSVRITEENIAFAYEVKAEIPTAPSILAGLISVDYLNARDEFTAREMFEKIEPIIAKRIAAAKETKLWRIEITDHLAQYDFESKSFPTNFAETTFIAFSAGNQNYAVQFANTESFGKVPVEIDVAKNLSGKLGKSRVATLFVEGTSKESIEKQINYSKRKTIVFEISKVSIKLKDGTFVGEFPAQAKAIADK